MRSYVIGGVIGALAVAVVALIVALVLVAGDDDSQGPETHAGAPSRDALPPGVPTQEGEGVIGTTGGSRCTYKPTSSNLMEIAVENGALTCEEALQILQRYRTGPYDSPPQGSGGFATFGDWTCTADINVYIDGEYILCTSVRSDLRVVAADAAFKTSAARPGEIPPPIEPKDVYGYVACSAYTFTPKRVCFGGDIPAAVLDVGPEQPIPYRLCITSPGRETTCDRHRTGHGGQPDPIEIDVTRVGIYKIKWNVGDQVIVTARFLLLPENA
jgi:hypothetical protein